MRNEPPRPQLDQGWYFLELMGHVSLAGFVRIIYVGDAPLIEIDVPGAFPQFAGPRSIYRIRATTEKWCEYWARRYGIGNIRLPDVGAPPGPWSRDRLAFEQAMVDQELEADGHET